jgi:hypothetical protein
VADEPEISFLGRVHTTMDNHSGASIEAISASLGQRIDVLLGLDALEAYEITFDRARGVATFVLPRKGRAPAPAADEQLLRVPMTRFCGGLCVGLPMPVGGPNRKFIFDTGNVERYLSWNIQ